VQLVLDYLPPSKAIADYVSAYYLFECDAATLEQVERADLAQLRFVFSGGGVMTDHHGASHDFHETSLLGPRMRAARVRATGPLRMFGLGILPAGWAAIVQRDASKMVDQIFDATDVIGSFVSGLTPKLAKAESLEEMKAVFEDHFQQHHHRPNDETLGFTQTVNAWLEESLNPDVASLVARTDTNQRTLERMMKRLYGAAPKQIARKYRALRAANLIVHGEGDWKDYAGELYYDHSHCIRDIKAFVGLTPAALRDNNNPLLHMTFGRRHLAGMIADISASA
jgi:AraC-like DNA-binding protein